MNAKKQFKIDKRDGRYRVLCSLGNGSTLFVPVSLHWSHAAAHAEMRRLCRGVEKVVAVK